jgi:antitoxin component YwqK of YwqJK toxin-antitoxin module
MEVAYSLVVAAAGTQPMMDVWLAACDIEFKRLINKLELCVRKASKSSALPTSNFRPNRSHRLRGVAMKMRMSPRHALWILSGAALLTLGFAGCSGSKEVPAEKPFAENTSFGSGTTAANSIDDVEKSGKALSAMLPKTPPPKLVEEATLTENYPDKKPKVVRGIKRFSDNSVKNHGHYVSYYQNGQKLEEGEYADNQKQGAWHMWYENGKEAKVENYLNGQLDGQWTLFNDKGLPEKEASYKAGQRSGVWKYYFPDGKQLKQQEEYRDDKLDGTSYVWYPNGVKGGEFHYQAGAPVGIQQQWYESGQMAKQVEFANGKPTKETSWDKDGNQRKP